MPLVSNGRILTVLRVASAAQGDRRRPVVVDRDRVRKRNDGRDGSFERRASDPSRKRIGDRSPINGRRHSRSVRSELHLGSVG
jgi:hypothetical protein